MFNTPEPQPGASVPPTPENAIPLTPEASSVSTPEPSSTGTPGPGVRSSSCLAFRNGSSNPPSRSQADVVALGRQAKRKDRRVPPYPPSPLLCRTSKPPAVFEDVPAYYPTPEPSVRGTPSSEDEEPLPPLVCHTSQPPAVSQDVPAYPTPVPSVRGTPSPEDELLSAGSPSQSSQCINSLGPDPAAQDPNPDVAAEPNVANVNVGEPPCQRGGSSIDRRLVASDSPAVNLDDDREAGKVIGGLLQSHAVDFAQGEAKPTVSAFKTALSGRTLFDVQRLGSQSLGAIVLNVQALDRAGEVHEFLSAVVRIQLAAKFNVYVGYIHARALH